MEVLEVDPDDDDAFSCWYAVVDAVHRAVRSGVPGGQLQELRAVARAGARPEAVQQSTVLAAVDSDVTVGAARLDLPRRDNRHTARLAVVAVLPQARRRGAATALVARARQRAAAHGRRELAAGMDEQQGVPSPGRSFALALGAACAHTEVRRDLLLPVDRARLDALEAQARPRAAGYRVVTWEGSCPDHLVEDRALLAARMSTEAPSGDLDVEQEAWDVARVRAAEQVLRDQGRARLAVGAVVRETGRMIAVSELVVPLEVPERASQRDTLVLREHRGHRLGLLLKVRNLRRAAEQWPRTRLVSTWNAEDNLPMIAVNEALGCIEEGTTSLWRLRVDGTP